MAGCYKGCLLIWPISNFGLTVISVGDMYSATCILGHFVYLSRPTHKNLGLEINRRFSEFVR